MPTTGPESSSIAFNAASFGRHALFDVAFHAFDHDDGVVHHQTDRQHQTKERKRVDGKTEHREKHERADQRDRHGEQRNQRGAPALQEDVDHQDYEREGDQQRYDDFLHAFRDRARGIQRDDVIQVFREALLHLRHQVS